MLTLDTHDLAEVFVLNFLLSNTTSDSPKSFSSNICSRHEPFPRDQDPSKRAGSEEANA